MKSNLILFGFGVFCVVIFCINSTNGRNVRFIETQYKREVDPSHEPEHEPEREPEPRAEVNDRQSQEKEGDNISATQSTTDEKEVEEYRKNDDNPAPEQSSVSDQSKNIETKSDSTVEPPEEHKPSEEGQSSAHVLITALAPAPAPEIAREEPVGEISQAQASNNEEVVVNHPAENIEKDVADVKPAASEVVAVHSVTPRHVPRKTYRSFWS